MMAVQSLSVSVVGWVAHPASEKESTIRAGKKNRPLTGNELATLLIRGRENVLDS
jgi:hypothetical protein